MTYESGQWRGREQARGSVLVVDDSAVVRAIVSRCLARAGFFVEQAENGASALRMLAASAHDVIVTDLGMPELDGFGLLASVKKVAPSSEVIILTGTHAQDVAAAVRALRLGAHDYLSKPLKNADEVVLTVERALEKKRLRDENERLLRALQAQSRTDALTGLPNRRCLDADLGHHIARSKRHGQTMSVMMLDLDHFKSINDTHGHQGGDEVLRAFAVIASSTLRAGDVLYRLGGEEFVALLPHADLREGLGAAGRVVEAVAASPIQVGHSLVRVTTSAGVASLAGDGSDLLARADAALYLAKRSGRNQARAAAQFQVIAGERPARVG